MNLRRQLSSLLLSGAVLLGCTVQKPEASLSPSAARPKENLPLEEQPVIDLAGRWKSLAVARKLPQVTAHAGYSHAELHLEHGTINCFVYDEPIDAGRALASFLSAAESGIDITSVSVESVRLVSDNPVVVVAAHFVSTEEPAGQKGVLRAALSPRMKFPVVCAEEGTAKTRSSFASAVEGFLFHMEPRTSFGREIPEGAELIFADVWRHGSERDPGGFRLYRAFRAADGHIHSLRIDAGFASEGGALHVSDHVASEESDKLGIISGRWLDLYEGLPARALQMNRSKQAQGGEFEYSYGPLAPTNPPTSQGKFTSTPIRGMYYRYAQLLGRGTSIGTPFLQYLPGATPDTPVEVTQTVGADGVLEAKLNKNLELAELGEDGLPRTTRAKKGGPESSLLLRELPPQGESPASLPD